MAESNIFSDSPSTKERAPLSSTPNKKGLLAEFVGLSSSNNSNSDDEGRWFNAPMCAPGAFLSQSGEGWSKYWSATKSWHQIVSRNKTQKDHYALHAFRSWSLLIMLNSPVTTGPHWRIKMSRTGSRALCGLTLVISSSVSIYI